MLDPIHRLTRYFSNRNIYNFYNFLLFYESLFFHRYFCLILLPISKRKIFHKRIIDSFLFLNIVIVKAIIYVTTSSSTVKALKMSGLTVLMNWCFENNATFIENPGVFHYALDRRRHAEIYCYVLCCLMPRGLLIFYVCGVCSARVFK